MARILVVDDNVSNSYMFEVLLKSHGHDVEVAADGAEALGRARARPPDLIVSDILMPVMDGFALCREWKSDPALKDVPFLIYTATFVDRKDEELALSLGADRFIVKPQDPEYLLQIVREFLERGDPPTPGPAGAPGDIRAAADKAYSEALFRKLEKKMAELEKANEALRASEARYRIVADNTSNMEFWVGANGEVRYVSPSCRRITGRDSAEFLADPELMTSIVHPDDRERFQAHRDHVRSGKVPGSLEFRILNAAGETRWIAHECHPVFDDEGRFQGKRGSNEDITERKRLEEKLVQAQKIEAVGLLAGGIAHDFNNILTAIIGFGALVQNGMRPGDPQRGNVDAILASAERAAALTGSLLAFSRKQEIRTRPVDLNDLTRNVEKLLRRIIGADICMEIRLRPGGVYVKADGGQIEQVLLNLATNARDAMPRGGRLTIETGVVEACETGSAAPGNAPPARYGMLQVSDDGVGMDESVRQRMFEPFYTTKEMGKGTGLGLSIVYGIVAQHGGQINVYSEKERGTTIQLLIPLSGADVESASGSLPVGAWPQGRGESVLFAEDDEMIRELTESLLKSLGYEVIMAADGQAAIDRFRERSQDFALVILDMMMPVKKGIEAYEAIRALKPDVKVLFSSGYSEEIIESKGLSVDGVAVLRKPYLPGDLARKVREILDR